MIITRTPLRISFFGGGTDLPDHYRKNGGQVLSTTIDKYQYITCRKLCPWWEHKHQFRYGSAYEEVNEIDEIKHPSIRETLRYFDIDYGLDLHYNTDIPARSGMGSSSAFTVGLVNALYGLGGKMASKRTLAYDAIHIEQDFIGEAVGSQDQIAAAFGGLNHIIFKKDGGFFVRPVPIRAERKRALEKSLVLIFTGFQRFATDIEKDKLENIRTNERSLMMLSDITEKGLEILLSDRDLREFGQLMNEAWKLKKTLSNKVSTGTIDEIYRTGMENGALGGKLLGAGGGGFMLFYCEPSEQKRLVEALNGYIRIPFRFEENGSQVIYYREE